MKYLIFIFLLSLELTSNLKAQNNSESIDVKSKTLAFSTGYFSYASIDELFAGQIYSGGGPFIGISHAKQKKITSQTHYSFAYFDRYPENLNLYENVVASNSRLRQIKHLHFEVDDYYIFAIRRYSHENFKVSFLLNWFTSVDLTVNNSMMPEQLLSSIAPGIKLDYINGKHSIEGHISAVVVAYTCRSNYSNVMAQDYEQLSIWQFIKSNSRIQSVNSFQTAYAGLLYHYAFSDKLNGVAYYNFRYMNNVKPRQLTAVSGVYGMGLTYNF
jgi:hypothetical protein